MEGLQLLSLHKASSFVDPCAHFDIPSVLPSAQPFEFPLKLCIDFINFSVLGCFVFPATRSLCLTASRHPLGLPQKSRNSSGMNTYKKSACNPFRMNTC